jgi:oligopeptide/dipeptide ABC transporter ATP-binding protein
MAGPLLAVDDLVTRFPVRGGPFGAAKRWVHAVDGVSFALRRGEVLGLVGESGSGKTTVGQTVLRLVAPTAGRITFDGTDITTLSRAAMRPIRRRMQIVFQDPFASLNPRLTIGETVGEPLIVHGIVDAADRPGRVASLLDRVGLPAGYAVRYPHELSGGQRQRVAIARALASEPDLIVADEPVSALDMSIQAQIIALIQDLRRDLGLAMLLIAHNLGVVEYVSDRVAVMYLGRIVETAPSRTLYARPHHPYTRALLSAAPDPDPRRTSQRVVLQGEIPSPLDPPSGCGFRTRCPLALPACAEARPPLRTVGVDHLSACIRDDIGSLSP